ncbi:MAG: hypothetical protein ABI345_15495 [Jatrophihabitans sp.]
MRVDVRGAASSEEIAAILAALAQVRRPAATDPYREWRERRVESLRPRWCRLER